MALSAKERKELEQRRFRIAKSLGSARFAIKHAGTGRAGAPAKRMTKERLAEVKAKVEALEAERREIIAQLEAEKPTEDDEPVDDEPAPADNEPEAKHEIEAAIEAGTAEPVVLTAADRQALKAQVDEAKRGGLDKA